jgi:hypothetical protein
VATLSAGSDEIFEPNYMPKSNNLMKSVAMQTGNKLMFANIPPHLQARGKGRCLKLYPLSKAEKIEAQLKQAEERIAKENAKKQKLQDVLKTYNTQDQDEIAKLEEREKIRAEVVAQMNEQANMFVQEQIKLAHEQMLAEIERRVALRTACDAQPREN